MKKPLLLITQRLADVSIHIAYEYNEVEHCLEYSTVIDDRSELGYLDDLEV